MPDGSVTGMLQRSRGEGFASLSLQQGRVRLGTLRQVGSAKVILPRSHGPVPEVVFLNTSGGLTGGDRLSFGLDLGPGATAVATTQTAERAYASAAGRAELRVDFRVGQGGRLDWLPQETILFDRSSLCRRTIADLTGDATFLMAEMIVLGRAAMGETLQSLTLTDWREIRRDGQPLLVEPLRLTGAALGRAATTGTQRALATIVLAAPGAEDALAPVRAALPEGIEAAASAWAGRCVVRLMAPDSLPLKRAVAQVLLVLRDGRPLPRVWQI